MGFPIEAKHVGGWETNEVLVERYQAQLQWQMIVTGAREAAISIIRGAAEPVVIMVPFDEPYAAELWSRAEAFMQCVFDLRAPVVLPAVAAPVKAEKAYDFATNNSWCSEAVTWAMHRQSAKDFAAAEKELKKLVPADAIRVTGGGLECKRDKANRLSIKELV